MSDSSPLFDTDELEKEDLEYEKKTEVKIKRFGLKVNYNQFDLTTLLSNIRKTLQSKEETNYEERNRGIA